MTVKVSIDAEKKQIEVAIGKEHGITTCARMSPEEAFLVADALTEAARVIRKHTAGKPQEHKDDGT